MKKKLSGGFLLAAVMVGILLVTFRPLAAAELKFGGQPYFSYAPLFVMIEEGYFQKAGVDVDAKISLARGSELLAALISGQYDIVGAGIGAGTFNAVLRGVKIKAIADKGSNRGRQSYGWILIRKGLQGEIKSIRDLRGRKIGSPGKGSASWIELGMILSKHGMNLSDVTLVNLRTPDRVNALKAGTIDAAIISEPFVAKAKMMGAAVELTSVGEELGEHQEAVLLTTEKVIREKGPELRKFLKVYVQGVKDYFANPNSRAHLKAVGKYTKLDDATLRITHPPFIAADGRVSIKSLERQLDWLVEHGHVKKTFPISRLVDHSLLP